jgi:hypothetical protein
MEHPKSNGHAASNGELYETRDVEIGRLVVFVVVLCGGIVLVGWLMWAMLNQLEGREEKAEKASRPSPFAAERSRIPKEPRLQLAPSTEEQIGEWKPPDLRTQHPMEEMKQLRSEWDTQLESYGWVDEGRGIVRIPISEAKRLLLERGLPARAK